VGVPAVKRPRGHTRVRYPALLLVRVAGVVLLALTLLAGFLSLHHSRALIQADVRKNLLLEKRMLAGFLADEDRQLRLVTAMAHRGRSGLLRRYLTEESTRVFAFALYDARGRRVGVWGKIPTLAPRRLPLRQLRSAARFRADRFLTMSSQTRAALLMARRDREGGWAVFAMKSALLDRLLFVAAELPGSRLFLRSGRTILARNEESARSFLEAGISDELPGMRALRMSVPLGNRRTNLALAFEAPASTLAALWWRRNLVSVVLLLVLMVALAVLERAVRVSLKHERVYQEKQEEAARRHTAELERRVRSEQRMKNIKEAQRLLNEAVARHLPEEDLFRHAVEILGRVSVGAGFWFAVYNGGESLERAASVTSASGWSLFVGPGVDPEVLAGLYAPAPGRQGGELSGEHNDPVRRLVESGEEVCLRAPPEGAGLDPRWAAFLERAPIARVCLFPILRDLLLVGHFGMLVGPDDDAQASTDEIMEFAREVARTVSYGLTDLAARQALEYAGLYDLLTSVPNRRLFYDRFQQLLRELEREATPFALAILDLDNFKGINDTYGHLTGDRVLVEFASRMRASLRQYDTVARLGGDEFALLLPRLDPGAAPAFLERLRASVVRPFAFGSGSLEVKCSLGLACAPRDGRDRETLMHAADSALYRAKAVRGGTWTIYDKKHDASVLRALPSAASAPASPPVVRLEPEIDPSQGTLSGVVLQRYDGSLDRPVASFPNGDGADPHRGCLEMLSALRRLAMAPPPVPGLTLCVPLPPATLAEEARTNEVLALLSPFLERGWRPLTVLEGSEPEMAPWMRLGVRRLRRSGVAVGWQFDPDQRYRPEELARFEIDRAVLAPGVVDHLPRRLWPSAVAATFLAAADLLDLTVMARGVRESETAEVLALLGCRRLAGPWVGGAFGPEEACDALGRLAQDRWNGGVSLPRGLGGFGDLPLLLFRSLHERWLDRGYVRLYLRRRGPPPEASACSLGVWIERRMFLSRAPEARAALDRLKRAHDAFHAALQTGIEEEGGELRRYDPSVVRTLWPDLEETVAAARQALSAPDPAASV